MWRWNYWGLSTHVIHNSLEYVTLKALDRYLLISPDSCFMVYSWLSSFVSVDVWTLILTARIYSFTFTENYTRLLLSSFVEDLQKIEWNNDGDGGEGGGWRNGAMGRQHITLEAHRSRISLLPCTFAAPRVALCATVRFFTDLANYEALTQFSWWLFCNNSSSTIELSSLVGSWLFCIQVLACSMNFQCMLGSSVEVWMKNILYRFVEGQTQFGMQWRGAKMRLALNESK